MASDDVSVLTDGGGGGGGGSRGGFFQGEDLLGGIGFAHFFLYFYI